MVTHTLLLARQNKTTHSYSIASNRKIKVLTLNPKQTKLTAFFLY